MKKTSVALLTTLFAATIVHSSWAIGDVNVGGEGIEKISLSGMNIAPISRDLDVTNNLSLDATQIPTAMDINQEGDIFIRGKGMKENKRRTLEIERLKTHQIPTDELTAAREAHDVERTTQEIERLKALHNQTAAPDDKTFPVSKQRFIKKTTARLQSIAALVKKLTHTSSSKVSLDQFFENSDNSKSAEKSLKRHFDNNNSRYQLTPAKENLGAGTNGPADIRIDPFVNSSVNDHVPTSVPGRNPWDEYYLGAFLISHENKILTIPGVQSAAVFLDKVYGVRLVITRDFKKRNLVAMEIPKIFAAQGFAVPFIQYQKEKASALSRYHHITALINPIQTLILPSFLVASVLSGNLPAAMTMTTLTAASLALSALIQHLAYRHIVKESQHIGPQPTTSIANTPTQKQQSSQFWEKILIGAVIVSAVGLALLIAYIIHITPIILALESM